MITVSDYLDFVEREYLGDFVREGGAAVKFAVTSDGMAESLRASLAERARLLGYAVVSVNADEVRVHMIDHVFAAIARQIDWDATARAFVLHTLSGLHFEVPEGAADLSVESLAALNNYDANELRVDLNRALQGGILEDYEMTYEFRRAMLRLCQAQVDRGDAAKTERDSVVLWLRGELRLITSLKQAGIFQKVARHNARDMLLSLTRWLVKAGMTGLVLNLDIQRCAVSKRPESGIFYTKAGVLDLYELLRQLIDATNELASCFVLVATAPETLFDPKRGFEVNYPALRYRVWNEVRDHDRVNPLAALIEIADVSSVEAVR